MLSSAAGPPEHCRNAGESKVILCVLPVTADFATQEAIKISRFVLLHKLPLQHVILVVQNLIACHASLHLIYSH